MLLVGNGRLITRDSQGTFYDDGCVAIEGQVIKKLGKTADLKKNFRKQNLLMLKVELLCRVLSICITTSIALLLEG
jgi:hypothetical protein